MSDRALEYARASRDKYLKDLCRWLSIASISTLPEYAQDVRRAAQWAANKLTKLGFDEVRIAETLRHPLVYAQKLGLDRPTLLVYGHYDVQPADPLEAWRHPPFDPLIDGDNLYARGASDDKGQAYAILAALQSILATEDNLPVNIKVLLEGEEEISSPNLFPYLREYADQLEADAVLIADSSMLDPGHPVIMYGLRGSLYVEIEVRGPGSDLHSGTFGGAVDNPFNVLSRLLASLQDGRTRRVLFPGFYDKVQELDEEERALIARAPISDQVGLHLTGAPALAGEQGYSLAERISVRPTMDIHGVVGGFTGQGKKTVIPSNAVAKVSMRLVPDQVPDEILIKLEDYLNSISPETVTLEVRLLGKAFPVKINYHNPAVLAGAEAYQRGFGAKPVYLRGGGTLPIVHEMIRVLTRPGQEDIPVVMMGFGLPDDNTHAPNEKIYLPNFYRGIETVIHFLYLFAQVEFNGYI